MKKRTRMLAGLLAAVLVVGSMVGCGGGEKKDPVVEKAEVPDQARYLPTVLTAL